MNLLQMSATGSCLIAAVAVFRAAFFRRLPKRTLVWLWVAAALVLLVPVTVPAACSIYGLLPVSPLPADISLATPDVAAAAAPLWPRLRSLVSALLALVLATAYIAGMRRFRCAELVDEPWAADWLASHPLCRPLTVRRSRRISAPVSGGILRPVILLPADMDGAAAPYVLLHEYVHIRRWDALLKLLLAAAVCLHWFNPLVWLMAALAGRDVEFACDESVLLRAGEGARADYARTLLLAESRRSGMPLFANGFGAAATLRRVEAVARFRRPRVLHRAAAALAGLALLAVFATSPLAAPAPVPLTEQEALQEELQGTEEEIYASAMLYMDGAFLAVDRGNDVVLVPAVYGGAAPRGAVQFVIWNAESANREHVVLTSGQAGKGASYTWTASDGYDVQNADGCRISYEPVPTG
ncbi:MAG: M56 family metallopeptidase [Ruminococcaceae bacterium]|nr:M56 family metallopeptidase [Oscillospiraceae bacterium]